MFSLLEKKTNSYLILILIYFKVILGLWELVKDNRLFSNFWELALWELINFFKNVDTLI
jgi:hypothetical protein